ncbi:MAG: hypothetical protein WKF35_11070 [Ferruginibacter sp.]
MILDAGYLILDAGCWMLDTGCWMLDCKTSNTSNFLNEMLHFSLSFGEGRGEVNAGYWMLDAGSGLMSIS